MAGDILNTFITGSAVFIITIIVQMLAWSIIHRMLSSSLGKSRLFFVPETLRSMSFSITFVFFLISFYLAVMTADKTMLDNVLFRVWAVLLLFTLVNIALKVILTAVDVHYKKKKDKAGLYRSISLIKSSIGIALYFIAFLMAINILSVEVGSIITLIGVLMVLLVFIAAYDQIKSIIAGFQLGEHYVGEDKIIKINGKYGAIEGIHSRSTHLKTVDGGTVVIPNKLFFSDTFELGPDDGQSMTFRVSVKGKNAEKTKERISSLSSKVSMSLNSIPKEYKPKVFFRGVDQGNLRFLISTRLRPGADLAAIIDKFCSEFAKEFADNLIELKLER